MANIDHISNILGIPWEVSKDIPFSSRVPFISLLWDLNTKTVQLTEAKHDKYTKAIEAWEAEPHHALNVGQKFYGQLLHCCLVIPHGQAYLTNLEAFIGSFGSHNKFIPHTPRAGTAADLKWWKNQLARTDLQRPIPTPTSIINIAAYSDASSETGIGITIGNQWRAWRLLPGWKAEDRNIGWAESVGFLLLVLTILATHTHGSHHRVYGDNKGVVEGWWRGHSGNISTNNIFHHIHHVCTATGTTILTRYVPSASNPADDPSRGIYGAREAILPAISIPPELHTFIANYDAPLQATELRLLRKGRQQSPKPRHLPEYREHLRRGAGNPEQSLDDWEEQLLHNCTEQKDSCQSSKKPLRT